MQAREHRQNDVGKNTLSVETWKRGRSPEVFFLIILVYRQNYTKIVKNRLTLLKIVCKHLSDSKQDENLSGQQYKYRIRILVVMPRLRRVHTIEFLKYDNNLKYPLCVTTALHTAGASEIWIDQSAFSGREKLYCPDITAIVRSLIG